MTLKRSHNFDPPSADSLVDATLESLALANLIKCQSLITAAGTPQLQNVRMRAMG